MNKSAVALAADSAVTVEASNGSKIYNTVNKLFCLTKCHPVGIMIYGNADINSVPWETLIKIYREKLGDKCFKELEDYAKDFISFLVKDAKKIIGPGEDRYVLRVAWGYLELIKKEFEQELDKAGKTFTPKQTLPILSKLLTEKLNNQLKRKASPGFKGLSVKAVLKGHRKLLGQIISQFFSNYPISAKHKRHLTQLIGNHFIRAAFDEGSISGVVIAGFGDETHFPAYCHYSIEGFIKGRLKYYSDEKVSKIDIGNTAVIRAFAQTNMAHAFMEGMEPSILRKMGELLSTMEKSTTSEMITNLQKAGVKITPKVKQVIIKQMNDEIKKFCQDLLDYRHWANVNPVLSTTAILPKDELAAMAEALVSLASFKKRVSMTPETVGGPVDVAVISKGDGFIWIKRKHYFKSDLNPDFFTRNLN